MMPFASSRRSARPGNPMQQMLFGLFCLSLTACAPLPDIAQISPAPAPVLVPISGILAQADALGTSAAVVDPVNARADSLRDRADRLRKQ